MSNGLVLNHHSLPFESNKMAESGIIFFLNMLRLCRTSGLKIILVDESQDKSLMGLELTNGYFIRDWYDQGKNKSELTEWRRFLKSIETKQPLFDTVDLNTIGDSFEVGIEGESSGMPVLLAAFHYNIFLASFTALPAWNKAHIKVWVFELSENYEQKEHTLLNLYDEKSLTIHAEELIKRRNHHLSTAKDIWSNRAAFFPNLTLLANQIGTALQSWSARLDILLKARDALSIMDLFVMKWKSGEYDEYRHEYLRSLGLAAEVSGESASVNNTPKKRNERLFWLNTGVEVYCENHVKLPDGYRMHFYVDSANKCIYVAYLGPHLTL